MKNLNLIGRILFCLPLLVFGMGHLTNAGGMAGMVPSFMPGGVFWVYLTGLALLAATVSILWGKQTKLAAMLLGVMLVIFALTIHMPMMLNATDEMAKMGSMSNMFKDLGLAGAAFYISSTFEEKSE